MHEPPSYEKDAPTQLQLQRALQACCFFQRLAPSELHILVNAVSVVEVVAGERIVKQGAMGDALYIVISGTVDCYDEHSGFATRRWICSREAGSIFGELSIIGNTPRSLSVYARGQQPNCVLGCLSSESYQSLVVQRQICNHENRVQCLRQVPLLETLNDEQIMKLADVLTVSKYHQGQAIIRQGDDGDEFFVVQSGECTASVQTHDDIQEVRRFGPGDLFGEVALLKNTKRAATITATTTVEVLHLSRRRFERMLGPLSQLRERQYLNDPRKLIADFFKQGTDNKNALKGFAVFRPTSRDAIAKMLNGDAVGKGLNVKGKSAKKNRLSGFVPFVQISDNNHKDAVEFPNPSLRMRIFYKTQVARVAAKLALSSSCDKSDLGQSCCIDDDTYAPDMFGLDVLAVAVLHVYILQPDLSPVIGWETGRSSEPAYMNMNVHAVCSDAEPTAVLYQYDECDPMNPRGLVIAYAEATVKPVVSDFDALLVGSSGTLYEPLPAEQVKAMSWTLDSAQEILEKPGDESWTSRWLNVLEREMEQGNHPSIPSCGFGDPTSNRIIRKIIDFTAPCGAVRHGAECFNFYFPQEADDEFLVIWDGFPEKPWEYLSESSLLDFLLDRVREGFSFPLNPVWAVRDPEWYKVLQALRTSEKAAPNLDAWFPPESGILDRIDAIHDDHPQGFRSRSSNHLQLRRSDISGDVHIRATELSSRLMRAMGRGKSSRSLSPTRGGKMLWHAVPQSSPKNQKKAGPAEGAQRTRSISQRARDLFRGSARSKQCVVAGV